MGIEPEVPHELGRFLLVCGRDEHLGHSVDLRLAWLSWAANLAQRDDLLTHVENAEIVIEVVLALHMGRDVGCHRSTWLQWVA